jgi:hypothetical protein
MVYHSDDFNVFNTWETPQSIQRIGAVVCNIGNVSQLQITINMNYQSSFQFCYSSDLLSAAHVYSRSVLLTISAYSSYSDTIINLLRLKQQYIHYIIGYYFRP